MTARKSILIADDEAEVRNLLCLLLEDQGYNVTTAADGDDAIAQLERRPFDLLLLDIKMPHLSGFDVLKHVREKHPQSKVIMLTAFAELANAMESKYLGADDFIGKPYDPNEVLMAIERAIGVAQ
jgi:two-component system response regulator PilR (NtrC family)